MRKIINSTYISLDGVIEEPHLWQSLPSDRGDTGNQVQVDLLYACDAVLMGRRTYDVFSPVWQSRSGDPYSDRINTMEKYVVSSTLKDPDWANTKVIDGDVVKEIGRLKEQPGQDIVQYGFGDVSFALLEAGLLDELRLWVHPQFVGRGGLGELLFRETTPTVLRLLDTTTLGNGIVILSYALD
ncbi:MAG TPA: dihydrofolate reductase family protein [Nocardioidaceae bacterium]|nr:dihydrofolate reductase family protein [Nocardioidaceae bacterium]